MVQKIIRFKIKILPIILFVLILFFCANPATAGSRSRRDISINSASAIDLAQPISGLELTDADIIQEGEVLKVYWLAKYIQVLYSYGIYLIGVLAMIMIMVGGLFWIIAGGNPQRITTAKNIIGGAVTGLLLGLCSYLILYLINPALIQLQPINVRLIAPDIKWCEELKEGLFILDPPSGQCGETARIIVARNEADSGSKCFFKGTQCIWPKICDFPPEKEKSPECMIACTASKSSECLAKGPLHQIVERDWACFWKSEPKPGICALLQLEGCKEVKKCSDYSKLKYLSHRPTDSQTTKSTLSWDASTHKNICKNDPCGKGCEWGGLFETALKASPCIEK